ncbi:MAG: ribonuclease HII [Candidatus Bipolaricaulia bacterium]
MTSEERLRSRAEELLAYDLAVCAWLEGIESSKRGGEIPFTAPPVSASNSDEASRMTLAGFDEAGRGSLAGPVAVACVHIDLGSTGRSLFASGLAEDLAGVDDSKRMSAARRDRLYDRITKRAAWGVGCSSADEIDRVGIVAACRIAARRAYRNLGIVVEVGAFDRGLSLREPVGVAKSEEDFLREVTATGADALSLHVACASIIAKVTRDRIMCRLSDVFGGYGLERHKGYGTAAHREAIRTFGPTRIHRRTFTRGCEGAKSQSC